MTDTSPLWYPYAQHKHMKTPLEIKKADHVYLHLSDGSRIIDAISSWWCMIHGYNHPVLNAAITEQVEAVSHVMLGGLTHKPAQDLASLLVDITPNGLSHVFFSDSGSVGCEVALKMAYQYWFNQGNTEKKRFLALNRGYHGDTIGVMAVGNPQDDCPSMHHMFNGILPKHFFLAEPAMGFDAPRHTIQADIDYVESLFKSHHHEIAAFICEPIMQGAGGFNIYSPDYLKAVCALCHDYNVLVIFDEVATGFGRTGKLFAANHMDLCPDIMVLGKALTAGYCGHSATMATPAIYDAFFSDSFDHAFMHGPTFMGNPIACQVAIASINLFLNTQCIDKINQIETILKQELLTLSHPLIKEVRILGAMAAIEVVEADCLTGIQAFAIRHGVFLRPFDNYVYTTPPYVITHDELRQITTVIKAYFDSQTGSL